MLENGNVLCGNVAVVGCCIFQKVGACDLHPVPRQVGLTVGTVPRNSRNGCKGTVAEMQCTVTVCTF